MEILNDELNNSCSLPNIREKLINACCGSDMKVMPPESDGTG
jgi:hypothetical protein